MTSSRFAVTSRVISLRRIRASWSIVRWTVVVVGLLGAAASLRTLVSPDTGRESSRPPAMRVDLAAQGYATAFARAYLNWDASRPDAHAAALASFVGDGLDPDAGLVVPSAGRESVAWTEVVQERRGDAGAWVYTVAVQTSRLGVVYLSVGVGRRDGQLQLAGYPSFVGAPQARAATPTADGDVRPVTDGAVRATTLRALSNYLGDQAENLRADLAPGANVALPGLGLRVTRLDDLGWAPGGGAVEATVDARGPRGPTYTLRYELDLTWQGGRPLVQAVQMNPTT